MTRGILLWTERPVLLEREIPTHEWMLANRPWEAFDLELIHDNAPGDWRHYCQAFKAAWKQAHDRRVAFLNVESDVVPSMEAFEAVLRCQQYACVVPYVVYGYADSRVMGGSAVIERRVPGGWESHFAKVGDEWASGCDLGFVRYSKGLTVAFNIDEVEDLEHDNGLLHERVAAFLRRRLRNESPFHLHFPGGEMLTNHHTYWDEGDQAHHPPGFAPVAGMLGRRPTPDASASTSPSST